MFLFALFHEHLVNWAWEGKEVRKLKSECGDETKCGNQDVRRGGEKTGQSKALGHETVGYNKWKAANMAGME